MMVMTMLPPVAEIVLWLLSLSTVPILHSLLVSSDTQGTHAMMVVYNAVTTSLPSNCSNRSGVTKLSTICEWMNGGKGGAGGER